MSPAPFEVRVPEERLEDLSRRLASVRWPRELEKDDWSAGTSAAYLRELTDYWREGYDWRARERAMNALAHFQTEIDEVPIHFVHERGVGPNPTPIILTHGWPWTFWDFQKVIGPLTDPAAHGGDPEDAFDVVVPSLPGFVFSTPLEKPGVNWATTADLWARLMRELGYERFGAHGGDWGGLVTNQLGHKYPERVIGVHLINAYPLPPTTGPRTWAVADAAASAAESPEQLEAVVDWESRFVGHLAVQALEPQTLSYALHDSPVGLCSWLIARRRSLGDCRGDIESRFSKDDLLDSVMLYWLTDSFASSARYYREARLLEWRPSHSRMPIIEPPAALTLFRPELPPGPVDWTSSMYDLRFQKVYERGGHFGAAEEPEVIIEDLRRHFRALRSA